MHLMGSNHMGPLLSSLFLCFLFLPENSVAWSIWLIYLTHTLSLSTVCVIPRWVGRTSVCFHTYWFLCCQSSSLISICFAIVHHTCLFSSDNPLVLKWMQYRLSAFCIRLRAKTSHNRQSGRHHLPEVPSAEIGVTQGAGFVWEGLLVNWSQSVFMFPLVSWVLRK